MTRGKLALLVAGGLLVASASTCVITYETMKRGVHYATPVQIDGKWDTLQVHYNHWFPRWRKSFDFTMGGHIWFRGAPQFKTGARTTATLSGGVVQRWMFAHAVMHRVQERRLGSLRYKLTTTWQFATIWTWNKRPTEREANAWQHEVAGGTAAFVQIPRLMELFPSNQAEPPDTVTVRHPDGNHSVLSKSESPRDRVAGRPMRTRHHAHRRLQAGQGIRRASHEQGRSGVRLRLGTRQHPIHHPSAA